MINPPFGDNSHRWKHRASRSRKIAADPRPHPHGHGHGHGHGGGPVNPAVASSRRRAAILLASIVVPIGVATVVGLIMLWPTGEGPEDHSLDTTYSAPGATFLNGEIQAVDIFDCSTPEERAGDPDAEEQMNCVRAHAELTDGPDAGQVVEVDLPPETHRAGVDEGASIRLLHNQVGPEQTDYYVFIDFEREFPLGLLGLVYAVLVVLVARMRGLRALLGLAFAYLMLGVFMLPALLQGESAPLVGLVGASAIMFVALYMAHGLSARTTTALLGTVFGLALTALLATWAAEAAKLTGMAREENYFLLQATDSLDLSQIMLCGIIVAGLGVLNDVTITQASAVWELYELSPGMSARRLFTGAMRIGRDHIASTVYTIAFAYAGAALPILLLIRLYERPILTSLTSGELAEEVVRTLVGSIGLVLAIPITTAIGVMVVKAVGVTKPKFDPGDKPTPVTS